MSVTSVDFAKFITNEAKEAGITDMSEMKLQKLLYICDGFMLALDVDFITEAPMAWNYGPIYPKVSEWLRMVPNVFESLQECSSETENKIKEIKADELVRLILAYYGKWSASELSLWSHKEKGPWEAAIMRHGTLNVPISKKDMKNYFKMLLNE
jgi:uncharacterized phage-associated protein